MGPSLFQREFDSKPYEMYVVGADGQNERQVNPTGPPHVTATEICEESSPAWSPDGSLIAFSWPQGSISLVNGVDTIEAQGIAVVRPDGSAPQLLTQSQRPTNAEDIGPVWSPDGSQIAFVRLNITAEPRDMTAVFVMNADGTDERQITPWDLNAADIDWSPDGSLISFRSEEVGTDFVGDLYTVRPDGSGVSRLTETDGGTQVLASSFSPDSEWLVFAMTGVAEQPDLFVMRTDGSDLGQLTATPLWESAPTWSPVDF
jgi:TolB protein